MEIFVDSILLSCAIACIAVWIGTIVGLALLRGADDRIFWV
ncbi:MAG TPA: hypothetical protein V6D17_00095 [Candidatus Obscuribacterales bacterium]